MSDLFNCRTISIDEKGNVRDSHGIFLFHANSSNGLNFSTEDTIGTISSSDAIVSTEVAQFSDPQKAWILERPSSLYYLMRGSVAMKKTIVPVCLENVPDEDLPTRTIIGPTLTPLSTEGKETLRFLLPRYEKVPYDFRGNICILYDGEIPSIIDDLTCLRTVYITAPAKAKVSINNKIITVA